jgi:hypothetical protein
MDLQSNHPFALSKNIAIIANLANCFIFSLPPGESQTELKIKQDQTNAYRM